MTKTCIHHKAHFHESQTFIVFSTSVTQSGSLNIIFWSNSNVTSNLRLSYLWCRHRNARKYWKNFFCSAIGWALGRCYLLKFQDVVDTLMVWCCRFIVELTGALSNTTWSIVFLVDFLSRVSFWTIYLLNSRWNPREVASHIAREKTLTTIGAVP